MTPATLHGAPRMALHHTPLGPPGARAGEIAANCHTYARATVYRALWALERAGRVAHAGEMGRRTYWRVAIKQEIADLNEVRTLDITSGLSPNEYLDMIRGEDWGTE